MMKTLLQNIFKIRDQELGKVVKFTLLGAILQAGLAIGISTADALFVVEVGSENLPIIYIILPFVMLVYTPIYSYLIGRYGIDRVFDLTLLLLVIGGSSFFLAFTFLSGPDGSAPNWVYYVAKLYTWLWYIGIYSLFWNFTDSYFDIQDGKRLFPLFSSGTALGTSVGGGIVSIFARIIAPQYLYLIWAGLAVLAFPALYSIKRSLKKLDTDDAEEEDTNAGSFLEQNSRVLNIILQSRYILVLTTIFFVTLIITTLDEYLYLTIFEESGGVEEVASLLGLLFLLTSIFNIIVNLFVFNRLVLSIGVRNVALIQPTVYLITFLLFALQGGYVAAIAGFFAYQGVLTSIEYNNQNFLFNAIPANVKQQVRTFIEGLCEPMATVVIGVFLLVFSKSLSPAALSTVGLGLVVVFWLLVLVMREDYLQAMITILREGWLDFSQASRSKLVLTHDEMQQLVVELPHFSVKTVISALNVLWQNDHLLAVRAFLDYLRTLPQDQWSRMNAIFSLMLSSQDYEIVRLLYKWLDRQEVSLHPSMLEELGYNNLISANSAQPLLDVEDPDVRGAAIVVSLNDWSLDARSKALTSLEKMLNGSELEQRSAIRALGRSRQTRYTNLLLPHLYNPSPIIRKETLSALQYLADQEASRLLRPLLEAIRMGTSDERGLAMDALMKISDSSCIPSLLTMSETLTPFEKRKAEEVILHIGLKAVPCVITVLKDTSESYETRSMAARALSRLSFAQFEALFPRLIATEIEQAYRFLENQAILQRQQSQDPGFTVLTLIYSDSREEAVSFILEMLTLGGRLPDFELLRASLRSDNPKERGNAIETIEQGVSRAVFQKLLPLLDSRDFDDRVLAGHRFFPMIHERSADDIVDQAVNSPNALECATAAQIIWDGQHDAQETLRQLLHQRSHLPLVREILMSLLFRTADPYDLNLIERIAALAAGSFFPVYSIQELRCIAEGAEELSRTEPTVLYEAGTAADAVYYILSGTIQVRNRTYSAYELVGEEALYGVKQWTETAKANDLRALRLPVTHIMRSAETYPNIAIKLLEHRINALYCHA
jgi:ATP/ADP translocase